MNPILQVFLKETREMMRDKRVISGAFVMPVFLIILMIMLFGFIESSVNVSKAPTIHVVKPDSPNPLLDGLRAQDKLRVKEVESEAAGRILLSSGKARLVVVFEPGFAEKLGHGTATIRALHDSNETTSQIALGVFRELVSNLNQATVKALLQSRGLPASATESIRVDAQDTAKKAGLGATPLVGLLPYLIVLWAFYGGMSIVGDLVAGEKERGTLETLLIAPISRTSIAFGKFLALCVVCLLSSMTSFVGLLLVGAAGLPQTKSLFPDGVHVGFGTILGVVAALVPLVAFFASLLLAVSAWAKNMREAQTYLTLVSFVVLMPAIFSQVIGFTDLGQQAWVAWTPILNTALCLREALLGKLTLGTLLPAIATSVVLALIGMQAVSVLFRRESILSRV